MRTPRDNRQLLADVSKMMKASYYYAIFHALMWLDPEQDAKLLNDEAATLLDSFMATNKVPEAVESFFIDILTNRLVFRKDGVAVKVGTD